MICQNKEAICIEDLSVQYGETRALSNVSLRVNEGDYLGIIGPNGGGKTTLLKSIVGLIPITSGDISIYEKKSHQAGKLIAYVPQISDLNKQFPITVQQVVLTGRLPSNIAFYHRYSKQDLAIVDEILNEIGIYKLKDRMISGLSGGEFQKMLIARALAIEPKILLLDEPTASVDSNSRDQIFSLLNSLNQRMTIILVTHDLLAVSSHVKSLACINNQLVYHGNTEFNEDVVMNLYGCPVDLIAHGVPHRVLRHHTQEVR